MKKKTGAQGKGKEAQQFVEFWLTSWRPYVMLFIAGIVVFGRSANFQFTFFDDNRLIVDGFSSLNSFSHIADAFRTKYLAMYFRPMVTISLIFDAQIGGMAPKIYHISNIIYHLLASCLVFTVLVRLNIKRSAALFFAMLFAVHPLATQAVAWVLGRNDSLLAIGILFSFLMLQLYESKNSIVYFLFHAVFFFIALLTKESAVVLPVLALYYLVIIERVPLASKKIALYAGAWVAAVTIWYSLRIQVMVDGDAPVSLTGFLSNLQVPLEMIGKMAIPYGLSTYPTFKGSLLFIGILVSAVCLFMLIKNRKGNFALGIFGLLWLVLFIFPSLAVQITDSRHRFNYLECRAYTPMFGFAIALASLTPGLVASLPLAARRASLLLILIFGGIAFNYSMSYKDPISHWEQAIETSPQAADTYSVMGMVYLKEKNNPLKAIEYFEKAVALDPKNFEYHDNLGTVYGQQGMLEKAETQFKQAIELESTHPFPFTNLAYLYILKKEYALAEKCLDKAYAIDSTFPKTHEMLAVIYRRQKNYDKMLYFVEKMEQSGATIDSKLKHLADSLRNR